MIIFVALILIVLCCVGVSYGFKIKKHTSSGVSTIPNCFTAFGIELLFMDTKVLMEKLIEMGEFTNKHEGIGKLYYGPTVIYVVSNAEDTSTILVQCMEKMFLYNLIKPYVGSELVVASVPVWKCNRRICDLAFKQHVVDKYVEVFNHQALRLTDLLIAEVGKDTDLIDVITRIMLEIVCRTTMGIKMEEEEMVTDAYAKAISKVLYVMTERFKRPWLIPDIIFKYSNLKKEQDEALKFIWNLSDQMVEIRKKEHLKKLKDKICKDSEPKFQSFLDILIENTVTEDSSVYTDLQLRQLVDNILLAGFDTTSIELLFSLVCIGSYPEIQDKIYDEIINVAGNQERHLTREDIRKLVYLEATVKETLRLYPIGPVIAREADKDVHLKNAIIPAGSSVLVHVWALNRNPVYWGADAEKFNPNRWLNPQTLPQHPAAFASFSPGRRNCIGKSYGLMVMKIILAHVLRKFRVKGDHNQLNLELEVLLKPSAGHHILLNLRDRKRDD